MMHVYPINDWIEHKIEGEPCPCEPAILFSDPETGEAYSEGLVIHNALDPDIK